MDQTIKVLHVDDESDFLYQAKIFLEKEEEKLYLTTSQTPKKALELLETQDFDVIVADYQMPSMDGLEFLKEIREERESDIPFIIFTGKGREEVAMKSLNLGADRYLQKGGDPKAQFGVLADAIMQEVSHYKSEKEKMQYTQELKFLNDVMINIARMKKVDEICDYIAEKVYTLNQENYVVVSLYDREIDAIRVRSFAGFDEYGQMIKEQFVSGEDKITFDPYILDEWKEKYRSGNLELMPEGLYSLVKGVLKKEEAKKFEELLGVEEVYSAGFSLERKPYGGITILKSEKGDPRFKSAIETIASQLSVILHKKQDEKRQRLSNFSLDNASLEIYWIRPDGEFIFANETVTDRLGYSKEKLKDMHVWDIDPNHNEDIRGERWEMLKEEGTLTFESEHETKDGDVYPVEITSSYLEFDGKEYEFAFAEDITERKKAEQKLKESEERYRTLFNSIRDAILVADTDRNIINCNPAFVDLFGYELEEIVGKKTKYVYHDVEQFEEMEEEIEEHMGEEDFYFTIDYEKKSEEVFPGETKVFYLRDDEGEITGFIGLIRDITERRRKDKKLEASEERYRRLFETAQDGMLILNAETGKIKDANPYIQDLLGYSKEELVGKELWEIGTFKSVVENRERFEELVEEGYIRYEDLPLKTKDGEEAPVEFVSNTYEASGEKVVQCNIRDINERKEKEKALQEAKKNYEELFEKSADALFVHDADTGEILNVNQRVCEMFGYSREEALEMTIEDFSSREHPYTQEEAEKRLQKAREEGPITLEWRAQKKDDTLFWVEITLKETKIGGESRILVSIRDISERKEREQELKRKDIYLDHIPEFVNVIDENGEIIYQSQTFSDEDVLGLDEIIGSNMLEFVHPDDREKVQETFFEALENPGEEYRIELRGKTEDGWKWFEGRAINYLEKPEIEGVIVTGQTIDERKKAEEELNKWSKAMKASMDGMAILDENEEYIYLNNAHAEIYGYDDTDELLGKTWGVLYDDEEIKRFEDEIMPTFREKGRWKGEAIGKKKDGTKFPQELSLTALEDGGLICVVRDITERKEAERQTEESKEKIEKLHQISANLETCQSEDEIYSYAIEAAKEILEFDMCSIKVVEGGLIVNKKASNDYPEDPEPLPVEDSIAGKAFLEKESFLNSDIHQEAEASPTLDIYRSGITVPIGKFAIFQAVSTEVDYFDEEDLKIAELLMDHVKEALKRVETEEREEFLHSLLRHDVKNKTQLVKGYLKLLEEDVDLPDEAKNYIQKAKKVTKVSDEIIEKVRKLKQIKQEDEIGEIEIDSVLDQILSEHKDQAEKKGIDIEVQTSECKVKGGTLLQEMISNLAENSIIHSDCDKIRIKDECEGNECVVTVEDDGKGIPDDVKEKIFERGYKQGENAGSGLGMYLVKEIVESYGGSVEVKDSEFGGAGFEIHLQRIR